MGFNRESVLSKHGIRIRLEWDGFYRCCRELDVGFVFHTMLHFSEEIANSIAHNSNFVPTLFRLPSIIPTPRGAFTAQPCDQPGR